MYVMLLILHIVVCFILILVVLLQTGKGADLAGAFGGGGSQTAFGSRGAATFLSKATTTAAVLFMVTSLSLALVSTRSSSVVLDSDAQAPAPAPTLPAPGVTPPEEDSLGQDALTPAGATDTDEVGGEDTSSQEPLAEEPTP